MDKTPVHLLKSNMFDDQTRNFTEFSMTYYKNEGLISQLGLGSHHPKQVPVKRRLFIVSNDLHYTIFLHTHTPGSLVEKQRYRLLCLPKVIVPFVKYGYPRKIKPGWNMFNSRK